MSGLPTQLRLEVATPLGRALDIVSDSVQVPGSAGELGVLPGHLPMLAATKPGILKYREGGQMKYAALGAGYAEADASNVRLIAEYFVAQGDIKLDQAKQDLATAQQTLKEFTGEVGDAEHVDAMRSLEWAQARVDLAGGRN